jgi:hypothetical protein
MKMKKPRRKQRKLSLNDYKNETEKHGHSFISLIERATTHAPQRINFKCGNCGNISAGRIYSMSKYCKYCKSFKFRLTKQEAELHLKKYNHSFIDFCYYDNSGEYKTLFKCGNCNSIGHSALRDIKTIYCRKCFILPNRSLNEIYLCELIKNNYPDYFIEPGNRSILDGKSLTGNFLEIDIVVKEQNSNRIILAIEWNGFFHHIDKKRQEHDRIKLKEMKILKIPFIQIDDFGSYDPKFVETIFENKIRTLL